MFYQIDFPDILRDTYHILAIYLGILIAVIILFLFIKRIDISLKKLNRIHFTKADRIYKLNYAVMLGIILIIIVSLLVIGNVEFRMDPFGFQIFAFFAFIALPIAIGFSAVYMYILKQGQYRIGDGILLLLSLTMFMMAGVHIHDVIWCGVATQWYSVENIGGYDLALFFNTFGITDTSRWDYRTFGLYMALRASIELITASLVYYKYIKLGKKQENTQNNTDTNEKKSDIKSDEKIEEITSNSQKHIIIPYVLFIGATIAFGIIEYFLDAPWLFSDLQYLLFIYTSIPLVTLIFIIGGLRLPSQK